MGDRIDGAIGDNGRSNAVGKGIEQIEQVVKVEMPSPVPNNHPSKQYTIADVMTVLLGDPWHPDEPGLIMRVKHAEDSMRLMESNQEEMRRNQEEMKRNQYPRWFQILMIVLATALLIFLGAILFELRIHPYLSINYSYFLRILYGK